MDRLKDKVAVVIGATSGIGQACAELFAAEGAKVVFSGRRKDNGEKIAQGISEKGGTATFVKADSTVHEELKGVIDKAMALYGRIDVLHNNAGAGIASTVEEADMELYDKIMNLNVKSYYDSCQMVIPIMKKQGSGSIINTCSIGAMTYLPQLSIYATSKGAIRMMTRALAGELVKTGIRVNNVCPGLIETEMAAGIDPALAGEIAGMIPMGKVGKAIDIAYGALYLASDESTYVTGTDLVIDGGFTY